MGINLCSWLSFLKHVCSLWIISIHLWIICVSCVSCVSHAFASVHCCLVVTRAGKGLTSWLLLGMFIVFLLLSLLVSWDRCGTWLYRFLIFAVFLTFTMIPLNVYMHLCVRQLRINRFYMVVSNSPMLLILNPSCKRMVGVKLFLIRFRPIGFSIQLHTRKPGWSIV